MRMFTLYIIVNLETINYFLLFLCFSLIFSLYLGEEKNSRHNNNNNVVFSIYHAEIVSRVENIVHSPIGSCTMIHPGHYFGIVNAKHNIII